VRNVNPEWYYGWDQEPDDLDRYINEQMNDPEFAAAFEAANEPVTESDEEES
jgi:uncharacterized protein (DUF736 family)